MWPSFRDCQPEKRNSISHSDDIGVDLWECEKKIEYLIFSA